MTTEITFKPWPKIARLNRNITITEKIDGTNAAVIITDDGQIGAQSRTRLITPEFDNFGFARWVRENAEGLMESLGPGRHFGEWWGQGIQRGYGLREKKFSLFNTARYASLDRSVPQIDVVPVLYEGLFAEEEIEHALYRLAVHGSLVAPGFMKPEGIVVYHQAAGLMFKVTVEGDEAPKSVYEAKSA